jgi:ABC-type nitrate/sulfonate/bicarbonate transport system substrate-binding protein
VGVSSLNSSSEAIAKFALQKAGLSLSDTKILNTGSPPNSLAALISGQVDAAVFSPPATFDADAKGFHSVFNGFDGGFTYLATSSLAKKSYIAGHHDLMLNYVKAMVLAEAGITKDKPGAIAALARVTQSNDEKTLNGTYDFYAALFKKYQVPAPSVDAVQAALNDFAVSVPAAKTAEPKTFIDDEFVKELDTSGFIKQAYGG